MSHPAEGFTPLWRDRIRFVGVELLETAHGSVQASVELSLAGGARITGGAQLPLDGTQDPELHVTALATLEALQPVLAGRLDLSLEGVRSLEAFGGLLVIVSSTARSPEASYPLVGAVSAPDRDPVRGAALAVLDSANRIVEHFAHASVFID